MKSIFLALILGVFLSVFLIADLTYAQEEMSMEEYRAQLAEWQKKEADARAAIAAIDAENDSLRNEITRLDEEINQVWGEIYSLAEVTEEEVTEFGNSLNSLEEEVDGLAAISPEELFKKRGEIDELEGKLAKSKENNAAVLTEMQDKIATIEGKIARLRASLPKAVYDEYTVIKGDYLWKISGKEDIYDDPYQWMRIYTYNRDQIKNPDLIYPDQLFKIQREVGLNEYLVAKGEYLAKISGNPEVFSDPTKWTAIYEANKDVIGENPNLIYPYQVLIIPGE